MLTLLASSFLKGVFFGTVSDFIRVFIGTKRMFILCIIFLSASFYVILSIEGILSLITLGKGLFTWDYLAFFIGLYPGGWMGTALGNSMKEAGG